jgi:outer membrane protein assembly factor BamB
MKHAQLAAALAVIMMVTVLAAPAVSAGDSVDLTATVLEPKPQIAIELSTNALNFGSLYPGNTSDQQALTITNIGLKEIDVTATTSDDGTEPLFTAGLLIDGAAYGDYSATLAADQFDDANLALHVPDAFIGRGAVSGGATFWAEEHSVLADNDWTTFQMDNYNSGLTGSAGPTSNNGQAAFATFTKAGGMSGIDVPPVVYGNSIYVMAQGSAFALNKTDGSMLWNRTVGGGFVLAAPVVVGDRLFVGTSNGIIACIDTSNGALIWSNDTALSAGQVNTPIVYDKGYIYFGTWGGYMNGYYCFSQDGTLIWSHISKGYYWAGAAVIGDRLVFGGEDGNLTCLDKHTGNAIDEVNADDVYGIDVQKIRSSMCYEPISNRLYFTSLAGYCYYIGFNSETGKFIQNDKAKAQIGYSTSTPAVYNGRMYVGTGQFDPTGSLVCLDANTMANIWTYVAGGGVQSSPAISTHHDDGDGEIYIYFTTNVKSGGLHCLKDISGSTSPEVQFVFTPPTAMQEYTVQGAAISDGMVYYGNDKGYLFALAEPSAVAPVAAFSADVVSGDAPLTVKFTDLSTNSPTSWAWDFDNDGITDSNEQNPTHVYSNPGTYTAKLTVMNQGGISAHRTVDIVVESGASPISDFQYSIGGGKATIDLYLGAGGDVVIPSTIEGMPVTAIGDGAFDSTAITSVTIPNSVTKIGDWAFNGCTALTSVSMPSTVTRIGTSVFFSCTALTSITIQDGVTQIGEWAFAYCSALTSITIPDSVISIGNLAFQDCTALTTVTAGKGVSLIGDGAFSGCTALTSMTFMGNAPTVVSSWANGCSNLVVYYQSTATKFTTPMWNGVPCYPLASPVSDFTYTNDGSLITITGYVGSGGAVIIPSTIENLPVSTIGDYAFSSASVTSVVIPNGVTRIAAGAFDSCTQMTSVSIPASVTIIGWGAFFGCSALTAVTIPNGVVTIDESAFSWCSALTTVTIPSTVTVISNSAFLKCALTSMTIPDGVTSIGESAFSGCNRMTSVIIPNSVTSIGSYAFYQCSALSSVSIPNSVTTIGSDAFYGCTALTSVTIGSGVTRIDAYAFSGCTALTSMTFMGNAPTVGSNWANGCTKLVVYYQPSVTGFTTPTWQGVPCQQL